MQRLIGFRRRIFTTASTVLAVGLFILAGYSPTASASGAPPSQVTPAPSGGVDTLHSENPGLAHGVKRVNKGDRLANGQMATNSGVYDYDPVLLIHGINGSPSASGTVSCQGSGGTFTNTISYLANPAGHRGLGSDTIYWDGPMYTVGFYDSDINCHDQLSTRYDNWAPACNGYGGISNSDAKVGTRDEPLAHVSCEFAWYVYNNYSRPYLYQNVKVIAHSMGGLIVRYAIQKVEQHDSHFPSVLYVSDVVTFSSPEGGITVSQAQNQSLLSWCNCAQINDMVRDPYYQPPQIYQSDFMKDATNYNHPDASGGTDWTMMGSLSNSDFLDWQSQSTYMSNSNSNSNNHRIGFSYVPSCPGQPGWSTGYGHGDYMNDQCDGFDASYYYCDGCSRDQKSFSFANKSTPHSLHNMLFAFVYANW